MDLRFKVVTPVACAAIAVTIFVVLVGKLSVAAAILGWVGLVAITWVTVDGYVWQPLQNLLRQRSHSDTDNSRRHSDNIFQQLDHLIAQARGAKIDQLDALGHEREKLQSAREALRESEERYALAVRSANDGLWEWDLKSNRMYLSPRWTGMLGYVDGEFPETADAWKERIFPEDVIRFEAILREHLSGATERLESEHRMLHKDGSYRWVMSRAMAIRHANGTPYRMLGLDTDTTAFKRIEEILLHVANGTSNVAGGEFFRQMVQHFALALRVRVVFVTRCLDSPPTRLRSVACWDAGKFIDEEYDLEATPCKWVIEKGEPYFVPRDLPTLYPDELPSGLQSFLGIPIFDRREKILGHLVFMDHKEMDRSMLMHSVYRIFTARAGVELERMERQQMLLQMARGDGKLDAEERLNRIVDLLDEPR